jgi:hypothetical protein
MPLDSIDRVNRFDAYGAALAYSESHLAVAYMINKYGIDGVPELLNAVDSTARFDGALFTVFGFSPQEYDRLVRNYIIDRYHFVFLMGDNYLFWIPGALLVIAGFIAVKIRNKRRKKIMEEEEKAAAGKEPLEKYRILRMGEHEENKRRIFKSETRNI